MSTDNTLPLDKPEPQDPHVHDRAADPSAVKDPADWVTGGEPMTGAQASYVHTLARQAGEEVSDDMTKGEASQKIEELQEKTGRGAAKKPAARKSAARKPAAAKKPAAKKPAARKKANAD